MSKAILIATMFGLFGFQVLALDQVLEATYVVPTENTTLKTFSEFPVKKVEVSEEHGLLHISYTVPQELTGLENKMVFEGRFLHGAYILDSANGVMVCNAKTIEIFCSVNYLNVKMDSVLAKQKLTEIFTGDELNARIELQEKFSTDPIGFVKIRLTKQK